MVETEPRRASPPPTADTVESQIAVGHEMFPPPTTVAFPFPFLTLGLASRGFAGRQPGYTRSA
jgi:hypothetical protein